MKKLLLILLALLLSSNAYGAWCRGFGGLFDWSKENKACAEYTRNLTKRLNLNEWVSEDAYCACRIRLDNLKKYGLELLDEDDYKRFPGLRSVRP
jgi:hypothetical protein